MRQSILTYVTTLYLATEDFNGAPLRGLADLGPIQEVKNVLEALVREGLVSLNYGDVHPNPHIKALPPAPIDIQIRKLGEHGIDQGCAYPERPSLEPMVNRAAYDGRPFSLALALGSPQLVHRSFELAALERYRNDPRFLYRNDDISGMISIRDDYFGPDGAPQRDQVSMQTFGFCFDAEMNCYVAAFVRYLANLSPEHQQYWAGLEIATPTSLHPDYFRPSILGEFPERISIYSAVVAEIQTINALAHAIRAMPFFRREYLNEAHPPHFGRLVRPTAHEFGQFVMSLDQMMSDNVSIQWFPDDLPRQRETPRGDGRVEVAQMGSIQLLESWIARDIALEDDESRTNVTEMLTTFREVRRLRMRPAHAPDDNTFRQELTREQRDLVKKVYRALKTLRLLLSMHPNTANIPIPVQISNGRIWSM